MKFMKRGVALALIAAWGLVSLPAQAYEKDKTYKMADGGGLYLEVSAKGSKYWRINTDAPLTK